MEKRLGFTLIELLIVVAIIVALAGFAMVHIRGARKNVVVQECKQIGEALNEYYHNNGQYPTDFNVFLHNKNYFTDVPKNPYGDGFGYTISGNTVKVYAKPESMGVYYEFKKSQMEVTP